MFTRNPCYTYQRNNKQQLTKTAKITVTKRDHQQRLVHSKSLLKQSQTFNDDLKVALWADVVSKLPDSTMKFALNAAQDCLPHNQNLFLWKKKPSDSCPLCGHTQSLVHVPNNCNVALQLRRYNKRHDAVFQTLSPPIYHLIFS